MGVYEYLEKYEEAQREAPEALNEIHILFTSPGCQIPEGQLLPTHHPKMDRHTAELVIRIRNVTSSKPATAHEAIRMAHSIMDQAVRFKAARSGEANKRKWENPHSGGNNNNNNRNNTHHHQQNHRQKVAKAYVSAPVEGKVKGRTQTPPEDNHRVPREREVVRKIIKMKILATGGVVRFGKKGKLAPRYVGPFKIVERVGPVAYRLRIPEELSGIHDTFHVSNLKKCLTDASLQVSFEEIKISDKLHFVEEPVEIVNRKVKKLKRKMILIVKVCWNSKRGVKFTWE
nr:reverse transcriptase domain-containing protein [Tanacetum cinerariifolium]